LYETDTGELIGYGSLGISTWTMPKPLTKDKVKIPVQIIPSLGIRTEFKHKPEGVGKSERYSARILSDLLAEAKDRRNVRGYAPILGLLVHANNVEAISFYGRPEHGFQKLGAPNSSGYIRMIVNLSDRGENWQLVG
jgi:hypothetical protein